MTIVSPQSDQDERTVITHVACRTLISVVGKNDSDLLPHFLKFYRLLHIEDFCLILHGEHSQATRDFLDCQSDVRIHTSSFEVFSETLKQNLLNSAIHAHVGEWILCVDIDEFMELPAASLTQTIEWMEEMGMDALPALMVQRLAADGSFPKIKARDKIAELLSNYDFNLCENMGAPAPTWKTKYPLFQVSESTRIIKSNHWSPNNTVRSFLPIRATLSHFKWRDQFVFTVQRPFEGDPGNNHELAAYASWLEEHSWLLPTQNSRVYCRQEMIERGWLIIPDRKERKVAKLMNNLRQVHLTGDNLHQVKGELKALDQTEQSWSETEEQKAMTNLENLCYSPGRVCFVTFELTGHGSCGGAGTTTSSLIEQASSFGHQVTVIYCPFTSVMPDELRLYWHARGVEVEFLPRLWGDTQYRDLNEISRELAEKLSIRRFDLVFFDDVSGLGGVSTVWRASGKAFQNTAILTYCHGNSRWHFKGNELPWDQYSSEQYFQAKQQFRLSDAVLSPSRYMQKEISNFAGMNQHHLNCPYPLNGWTRSFNKHQRSRKLVEQIVFFGRLELRKGLDIFLEAMQRVCMATGRRHQVVFLGRFDDHTMESYLRYRTSTIDIDISLLTEFDSVAAVNYLKGTNSLAVMPSKLDNLPNTVIECAENGIPFVTSNVGGIPEIIDENDHSNILIARETEKLSNFIQGALEHGVTAVDMKIDADAAALRNLSLFSALVERGRVGQSNDVDAQEYLPAVIVYSDPQTEPCKELLNVLNDLEDKRVCGNTQIIGVGYSTFRQVAIKLNTAVRAAKSNYVFLCEGNTVPLGIDAVNRMIRLASCGGFDAVVGDYYPKMDCDSDGHKGATLEPIYASAGPPEFSASWSIYGAGLTLLRRDKFLKYGGLNLNCDKADSAHWEILNTLVANGCQVGSTCSTVAVRNIRNPNVYSGHDRLLLERLTVPWLSPKNLFSEDIIRKSIQRDFGSCPYTYKLCMMTNYSENTNQNSPEKEAKSHGQSIREKFGSLTTRFPRWKVSIPGWFKRVQSQNYHHIGREKSKQILQQGEQIGNLDSALTEARRIVKERDEYIGKLDPALREAQSIVKERDEYIGKLEPALREAQRIVKERDDHIGKLDPALKEAQSIVKERDEYIEKLDPALKDIQRIVVERDEQLKVLDPALQNAQKIVKEQEQRILQLEKALQEALDIAVCSHRD